MKQWICILMTLFGYYSLATPVIDTGVGSSSALMSTILPDDSDKSLFYFFPYHYDLSVIDNNGRKSFSCLMTKKASGSSEVNCYMAFEGVASSDTLKKIQEIKAANPQAKFAPIPYIKMSTQVMNSAKPNFLSIQCQPVGSEAGQQVACNWSLAPSRFAMFRKILTNQVYVQVMYFNARFMAVSNGAKIPVDYSVPMYVSNLGKGDYFYDNDGNVLH